MGRTRQLHTRQHETDVQANTINHDKIDIHVLELVIAGIITLDHSNIII